MFFDTSKDELIKETILMHNNQSYSRSFFTVDKLIFIPTLLFTIITLINPQDSFFKITSVGYNACVSFILIFSICYFLIVPQQFIVQDCIKEHISHKIKLHSPTYYLRSVEAIIYYVLAALGFYLHYYLSASLILLFPILTFFFFKEIHSRIENGVFQHYQNNPTHTNNTSQHSNALVGKPEKSA